MLSALEVEVVRAVASERPDTAIQIAAEAGLLTRGASGLKPNRERSELEQKLRKLRLPIPWRDDARASGASAETETAAHPSS